MKNLPVAIAILSLSACATNESSTDPEGDDAAVRVRPIGEDVPGTVTVIAPTGVATPEARFKVGNKTYELNSVSTAQSLGSVSVTLDPDTNDTIFLGSPSRTTTITADATAKLYTGRVALTGLHTRPTWGVTLTTSRTAATTLPVYSEDRRDGFFGLTAQTPVVQFAGSYQLRFGLAELDGHVYSVAQDQSLTVDVTDQGRRAIVRILPSARELPNGCNEKLTVRGLAGSRREEVVFSEFVPVEFGIREGEDPRAFYELQGTFWSTSSELPRPAHGTTVEYQIGRIDVDDVIINGMPVRGTYHVNKLVGRNVGNAYSCEAPTNSGVDVPPGTYRVTVTYNTVAWGRQQKTYDVTVP